MYIPAPEVLSVEQNREAFLGLIYEYHWHAYALTRAERGESRAALIDLSPVRTMTLDAALVLTAEYHRRVIHSNGPALIDDRKWDQDIRSKLNDLGLYELVKSTTPILTRPVKNNVTFVPFHSGINVDQSSAKKLISSLRIACGTEPEKEYIYGAIVEAIKNVWHHAYTIQTPGDIPSVRRWWTAGAFDAAKNVLEFIVYDQGAGIPATLPRRPFYRSVLRLSRPERTDADLIAGALRYGRTRFRSTGIDDDEDPGVEEGRGNGLWSICEFIPRESGSSVRILSGRGEVVFDGQRAPKRSEHNSEFCGTMIQWTLKLPSAPISVEVAT